MGSSAEMTYPRRGASPVEVPLRRLLESRVVPIATVVLLGVALVLPGLGSQSLWLDEGLTVGPAVAATSVVDLLARVRAVDTQPPASHFLLWTLCAHMPHTEFFYRLPSFVAVELGIILLYALTRRLWGPLAGLAIAACAQFSPYLCFYAAEARNYGLWFLCITASALAAACWYDAVRAQRRSWGWALALALANALGLWTHLFHVFVLMAETTILALAVASRPAPWAARRHGLVSLATIQLATAVLFAPWAMIVWYAARSGTAGVLWTRPFTRESLAYYAFAAHFGVSLGPDLRALHERTSAELAAADPLALTLAAAAMAVSSLTYLTLIRDSLRTPGRGWELVPLVAWPLLTLAGPLAYASLRSFPLHPRHLLLAWPILPVILGLGLVRYRRLRPVLIAALVLQTFALGNLLFNARYAKDDERGAVRFAEAHSGSVGYVLGDVASLYVERTEGRIKNFRDFRPDTNDVWLVDNRRWEEENQHWRVRLKRRMQAMGLRYEGGITRFRGIILRHWTAP